MPILYPRRTRYSSGSGGYSEGYSSGGGFDLASIGGIVVVAILAVFVVAFFVQWRKAKQLRARTGKPIPWGSIMGKSLLYGIGVGFILLLVESFCGGDGGGNDNSGGGNDGGMVEQSSGMGFVPMPLPPQPAPVSMDYGPVQSEAMDGVQ